MTSLWNELYYGLTSGLACVSIPCGTTIEEIEEAIEFFDAEFDKEGDTFLRKCLKGVTHAHEHATNYV